MSIVSLCIAPDEVMGRRINSSSTARKVRNGRVPVNIFLQSCINVSMDRLIPGNIACASRVAESHLRSQGRSFYGWAAVSQDAVRSLRLGLVASPQCGNQFHADIVLPCQVIRCKRSREKHAAALAAYSRWEAART